MAKTLIGALRVTLGLDSAQFEQGASRAQATADRLGRRLQRIGAVMSVVGAGVAVAIRGQLTAADELGKAAQSFGVPVEELSALAYAADLSGVSLEQLGTALGQLARNMREQEAKFADLGIAVRDASGEFRPMRDVMVDLAARFASMPDGAQKTAEAMDLMGRSGAQMIPLLNAGADGLKAMTDEAAAMGLVITDETAKAAEQFNDNLTRLHATGKGLVVMIASNLAPAIAAISDSLVGAAKAFQDIDPAMQKFISFGAAFTAVIGPVLIVLGTLVRAIAVVAGAMSAPGVGLAAVIIGVAAAAIYFRDTIADIVNTVLNAFHSALMTVAGAIAQVWNAVTGLTNALLNLGRNALIAVQTAMNDLLNFLRGLPGQMLEIGRQIIQGLVDGIMARWAELKAQVTGIFTGIADQARSLLGIQSPSTVFAEIGQFIAEGLAQGIENGAPRVGQAVETLRDTAARASDGFRQIGSQLADMFADAFAGIVTGAQTAREALANLLRQLAAMLANAAFRQLFGGLFSGGFGASLASFFGIGGFASGTASAGRGLALVGEEGPELVNFRGGERVWNTADTARMMTGSAAPTISQRIINVLDASLLGQYLDTPGAEQQIVNIMRRSGLAGA